VSLDASQILIAPVVSEAATIVGIDTEQMMLAVPQSLPSFHDSYQMHTGILDTLKTP